MMTIPLMAFLSVTELSECFLSRLHMLRCKSLSVTAGLFQYWLGRLQTQ